MPEAIQELRGRRYSGDLYGRKFGSSDTFQKLGNVSALSFSKDNSSDDLTSTGKYDYGQALDSVTKPGATKIKLEFNTFDRLGLARMLMGAAVDLPTAPQTVSDEAHTAALDGWIALEKSDIDPTGFAIKSGSGAGTPVPADHYEVNYRMGMFRFTSKATVSKGDELKVSYKTKGSKGYQIDADTLQRLDLELRLDGRDRITGKDGELNIYHGVLQSDGNQDWMSDDWWKAGLSGTAIKPADKPSAYRFTQYD